MAKKKEAAETAEGKKPGGRTIAAWKKDVFSQLPNATDEEIAAKVNAIAADTGYTFKATADDVKRWKSQDANKGKAKPKRGPAAERPALFPQPRDNGEEGEATGVLKQLVKLIGKDGVKKLVDGL